jgi:fructose-1,6-bisphosphatase/sedoheptulose 1,7-bisphosphatase-like protein
LANNSIAAGRLLTGVRAGVLIDAVAIVTGFASASETITATALTRCSGGAARAHKSKHYHCNDTTHHQLLIPLMIMTGETIFHQTC